MCATSSLEEMKVEFFNYYKMQAQFENVFLST